jgi:hypothetical protein
VQAIGFCGIAKHVGHPTFEFESVVKDDLGLDDRDDIVSDWFVEVGIDTRRDQLGQANCVPTDAANHIGHHTGGCNHVDRFGIVRFGLLAGYSIRQTAGQS